MSLDINKLVDGIHEWTARQLKPLASRVKALEEENKDLRKQLWQLALSKQEASPEGTTAPRKTAAKGRKAK